jgi:hypothetical protein
LADKSIKTQQPGTDKSVASTKETEAHKKAQKDAIKKLLDQLAELNRRVQL